MTQRPLTFFNGAAPSGGSGVRPGAPLPWLPFAVGCNRRTKPVHLQDSALAMPHHTAKIAPDDDGAPTPGTEAPDADWEHLMRTTSSLLQRMTNCLALLALPVSAHASLTVYTDPAAFAAATTARGTDNFADLVRHQLRPVTIERTAGAYGYTAGSWDGLAVFGTVAPALGPSFAVTPIYFSEFTGGASAIGVQVYTSDRLSKIESGVLSVWASDVDSHVDLTLPTTDSPVFIGFVSTTDITGLSLFTGYQDGQQFPYRFPLVTALTLGVASVPEPAPATLLLLGLSLLVARRRRLRR